MEAVILLCILAGIWSFGLYVVEYGDEIERLGHRRRWNLHVRNPGRKGYDFSWGDSRIEWIIRYQARRVEDAYQEGCHLALYGVVPTLDMIDDKYLDPVLKSNLLRGYQDTMTEIAECGHPYDWDFENYVYVGI